MICRITFTSRVPIEDIESSLVLALFAVESLYGEAQVRLDAGHYLDEQGRACVIDTSTHVGADLCRIFIGFLRREFDRDAFVVKRIQGSFQHN